MNDWTNMPELIVVFMIPILLIILPLIEWLTN